MLSICDSLRCYGHVLVLLYTRIRLIPRLVSFRLIKSVETNVKLAQQILLHFHHALCIMQKQNFTRFSLHVFTKWNDLVFPLETWENLTFPRLKGWMQNAELHAGQKWNLILSL